MDTLCIKNLYKAYGDVPVLKEINLSVAKGEFLSLLGPSGCGKTTLLRIIAGLTEASGGEVLVEGKDISTFPPFKRNNGMVFQNYALFPHMSVYENIAFGLKVKNTEKNTIRTKVEEGLAMVHLEHLAQRYPKELSGGQQQRVALIRALVLNPTLLLLDEPLCNLDAKLRQEMRVEIRKIQKKLNVTTIFVTHDQEEALSMSDRIAVMNAGHFEQVGSPAELYEMPKTKFVANFIGSTNLIEGEMLGEAAGYLQIKQDNQIIKIKNNNKAAKAGRLSFSIRPERIVLSGNMLEQMNNIYCTVITRDYLGATVRFVLQDNAENNYTVTVQSLSGNAKFIEGDKVIMSFHPDDCLRIEQ